MKFFRALIIASLLLGLLTSGIALAQTNAPSSVLGLFVTNPATAGSPVQIGWDADVVDTGTVSFRVYVPADWYTEADWETGTGVTATTLTGVTYSVASCTNLTILGVPTYCAVYSATDIGDIVESFTLEFTVASTATVGANRPVRVTNNAGSGGTPNISTALVTVAGVPSTRYVGDTSGDCAGNTPCDTGATALQVAVDALPAAGGTIYVGGVFDSFQASLGSKNITLRPLSGTSILVADSCPVGTLLGMDSGNLTIDGLAIDRVNASCNVGVENSGTGNLSVVNGASLDSFTTGILSYGSGTTTITSASFNANTNAVVISNSASATITGSTFTNNTEGVWVLNTGSATISGSTFDGNSFGVYTTSSGLVTVHGNIFVNGSDYAVNSLSGNVIAFANAFSGNNSGGFQAYTDGSGNDFAKNWWGSYSNSAVGPTADGSASLAAGWDARLGADVASYAFGTDGATLGAASVDGGSGTAVIISFGRGSFNAPFANGIPPYVNRTCSDYYDFYVFNGSGDWDVRLPIDDTTDCNNNVLVMELAYKIEPGTYDSDCATVNNPACWDAIDETDILADVENHELIISQSTAQLNATHFAAGDAAGQDPTAISLTDFTAESSLRYLPLMLGLALLALLAGGLTLVTKRFTARK